MVSRKPIPDDTSVVTNATLPSQDMKKELWSATESPANVDGEWDDAFQQNGAAILNQHAAHQGLPGSLKPGAGPMTNGANSTNGGWNDVNGSRPQTASDTTNETPDTPLAIRPGPPQGPPSRSDTNPFKRKEVPSGSNDTLPQANTNPTMPPVLAQPLSQTSTGEISNNPWQPALDQHALEQEQKAVASSLQQPLRAQPSSDAEQDAWSVSQDSRPPAISTSPALVLLSSEPTSPAWDDLPENQTKQSTPPAPPPPPPKELAGDLAEEQHIWDEFGSQNKAKGKAPAGAPPATSEDGPIDDWNLIDAPAAVNAAASASSAPFETRSQTDGPLIDTDEPLTDDITPPELPPRNDEEQAHRQPHRPVDGKSETYQIKNINWYDHNAEKNPRTSPVLVQNANGPCPLVALVNALTLTTPASMSDTALVQVLRSREQISLGYLLDAVFDELMSDRRTHEDAALPDVTELYDFLKGLHTGMNVNPRFIPTPEVVKAFKRTSLTHLHPTERDDLIPGTFEDTTEMALYAAFSIPLIHGWLPQKSDPAYGAFERQAASFEDVQGLLFRDEELQEKLGSLTEEEEQMYSDIQFIKAFLESSATQLTPCGLDVITKAMKPGSVAILFRNDHFSTLYRHPTTLELLVLVTDAGYASHDEIVWESLADVNGERTEYYSGDFRIVGGQQMQGNSGGQQGGGRHNQRGPTINTNHGNGGDWTTIQIHGRRKNLDGSTEADEIPLSPNHEQEDRDLALALQLQEEEEQRHRAEQAARRRESILSEQFIEQQARVQQGPTTRRAANRAAARAGINRSTSNTASSQDSRRNSNSNVSVPPTSGRQPGQPPQMIRPLVPPTVPVRRQGVTRPADEGVDDAPPTYEQAQAAAKYEPPPGHPHHHASSPTAGRQGSGSGAGASFPIAPGRPVMGGGRGRVLGPGGVVGSSSGGRERDCIVM